MARRRGFSSSSSVLAKEFLDGRRFCMRLRAEIAFHAICFGFGSASTRRASSAMSWPRPCLCRVRTMSHASDKTVPDRLK